MDDLQASVQRHLDVLQRIFLLRKLPPYFRNVGKRLVKAPKLYLRDTGLLHHSSASAGTPSSTLTRSAARAGKPS